MEPYFIFYSGSGSSLLQSFYRMYYHVKAASVKAASWFRYRRHLFHSFTYLRAVTYGSKV
jgi:hypothetical protein